MSKAITSPTPVTSLALLPWANGGARLTINGEHFALSISDTNALLRGLLNAATIEIKDEEA